MADDEYIELILQWSDGANQQFVRQWFEGREFSTSKMMTGLLLLATRPTIEKIFSVTLDDVQPPIELPIPLELQPDVASITFPRPRSYHT